MMRAPGAHSPQHRVINEFRANAGRVGGYFTHMPLLLLSTLGARSGMHHTTPLAYMSDGDSYVVVAANAGAPRHPDWYHNLAAAPGATVEVGTEICEVTAVVETGARREELFRRFAEGSPQGDLYQAATTREIPVISLIPVRDPAS
ncbi:nitroreductase family deazaflavin-dependent oxidoreductase [Streptomyces sp. NBC_00631]|uniref:nitroreductase family deazaflavin-dependent oxidoreductase n=1 Tax=Streptomyces sp. NBC_00631 TaxID=2975793 RepID=UPI0030E04817